MFNLFGDDTSKLIKRKSVGLRALPAVPFTGWRKPETFPNLSSAWKIGIDTETYDPELLDSGPGWARHRGHIVGISLSAVDYYGNRGKWYFPMRHTVHPEDNMDPEHVLAYMRHTLSNPYQPKVFAHAQYDMGWLQEEGVKVEGEINDVQYAEALIDNNARVGLDILGHKYLRRGKAKDLLEEWITAAYKPNKGAWRGNIYRAPPSLAGPYAEDDAMMPLNLLEIMGPILEREQVYNVYRMECDLIRMEVAMRFNGVYVNVEKAQRVKTELEGEIKETYEALFTEYGIALESTDSRQIGKLLKAVGIAYPTTPKTQQPKIEAEWLDALDHPLGVILGDLREKEKICGTFIQSYILDKNINGLLFPSFNPLKGESKGAMIGRFSSDSPNLQNIPTRTKLGKKVRSCFEPRPGRVKWRKNDYSQIHYRILAENAVDRGDGSAEALRQAYINDPAMDYHLKVYKDVAPIMGWSTDYTQTPNEEGELVYNEEITNHRRVIKNINFSGLYGVGEETVGFKYLIGMSRAQVKEFLANYHEGAPYIKATMEAIAGEAERCGFVTSLLGRRTRFYLWEPRFSKRDEDGNRPMPLPYNQALEQYGTFIRLAYLYRAVNYKFQSSEPDIMKHGMLDLWNSGVLDYVGVPSLTVHDELDWEQLDDSPQMNEAFRYVKHTMENTIKLRVPIKVDSTTGVNWSKAA